MICFLLLNHKLMKSRFNDKQKQIDTYYRW